MNGTRPVRPGPLSSPCQCAPWHRASSRGAGPQWRQKANNGLGPYLQELNRQEPLDRNANSRRAVSFVNQLPLFFANPTVIRLVFEALMLRDINADIKKDKAAPTPKWASSSVTFELSTIESSIPVFHPPQPLHNNRNIILNLRIKSFYLVPHHTDVTPDRKGETVPGRHLRERPSGCVGFF